MKRNHICVSVATEVMPKQRYVTLHEHDRSFSHIFPVQKHFFAFQRPQSHVFLTYSPVPIGAPVCYTVAHFQKPDETRAPWLFSV